MGSKAHTVRVAEVGFVEALDNGADRLLGAVHLEVAAGVSGESIPAGQASGVCVKLNLGAAAAAAAATAATHTSPASTTTHPTKNLRAILESMVEMAGEE